MLWALLSVCCLGAIVNGPLFSLDASGAIGKALVYTKWKGRNVVREYVTPANPNSILQRGRRTMMTILNAVWATMDTTDRDSWTARAAAGNYSTFNAFTSFNLLDQSDNIPPTKNEGDTPTTPTAVVDTLSGTGGSNRIDFQADADVTEAGGRLVIALIEGASAPGKDLLRLVGQRDVSSTAAGTVEVTGLEPGTYSASAWIITEDGGEEATATDDTSIVVTGV